eukprot:scaffold104_cov27-Attheya_sp.AAC.1
MEVTTALRRRKANDSGQQKTTTYPMGNAPNVVTPPSDSYCHSCGYDLPTKHDSKVCRWKKDGHKDSAPTITSKMGGTERNCFHYKSP